MTNPAEWSSRKLTNVDIVDAICKRSFPSPARYAVMLMLAIRLDQMEVSNEQ